MKCNRSRPEFELVSPCPFPATITIIPRALYLFIICQDYVLLTLIDLIKEDSFTRNKWYSAETITDANDEDDLALLTNTFALAESLPHSLEQTAKSIGFFVNSDKRGKVRITIAIEHTKFWFLRWNKTRILPIRSRVSTIVWQHHLEANKTFG